MLSLALFLPYVIVHAIFVGIIPIARSPTLSVEHVFILHLFLYLDTPPPYCLLHVLQRPGEKLALKRDPPERRQPDVLNDLAAELGVARIKEVVLVLLLA